MGEYARIWESFVSGGRLEFGGHMDLSWQGGHALSASLIVEADASRFRERLQPPRDALRRWPFVSLHPDHFMHITLFLMGFLVEEPEQENEVSRERLSEIEAEARRALEGFPAFTVELANLNAFPGAAFIEAHDGGRLEELRDTLCAGCGLERPPGPPHLTLAYFEAPDGAPTPEGLVSDIRRYRQWPVGEILVDAVEMTLLDLTGGYPEPRKLAEIELVS